MMMAAMSVCHAGAHVKVGYDKPKTYTCTPHRQIQAPLGLSSSFERCLCSPEQQGAQRVGAAFEVQYQLPAVLVEIVQRHQPAVGRQHRAAQVAGLGWAGLGDPPHSTAQHRP